MSSSLGPCVVCQAQRWTLAYEGPVRKGRFGSSVPGRVFGCGDCGVQRLEQSIDDPTAYYGGDAYREDVDAGTTSDQFFATHDSEQPARYSLVERFALRGSVIADIGCGAGSFLDGLKGFASQTVAVEPMLGYHTSLLARGHRSYESAECALADWEGRVDLAVCFSVIEHVPNPVDLLREIHALLRPSGTVLVSTPNLRDILLQAGCEPYRAFFYRTVHTHYFDVKSLSRAATAAGFTGVETLHRHRFNFANFLGWMSEGRPTQNERESPLGGRFDRIWRAELEEAGTADYLYAYCTK
jgi:SAM-dependent methyltransferase